METSTRLLFLFFVVTLVSQPLWVLGLKDIEVTNNTANGVLTSNNKDVSELRRRGGNGGTRGGGGGYGWGWGYGGGVEGGGGGGGGGGGVVWGWGVGDGGGKGWGCGWGRSSNGKRRRRHHKHKHTRRVMRNNGGVYKLGEYAHCLVKGHCMGMKLDCPLHCGGPCFYDCKHMCKAHCRRPST